MPLQILIVGAGAVGAFYGSRLAHAPDVQVSVICRSNYAAVKRDGFHVTSPTYGEYKFTPAHTFANPAEARAAGIAWDYVVVSTKALPDVSDDSKILEGLVDPRRTAIVLIQNGLGVEEPYVQRYPGVPILSAVTIVSAEARVNEIHHNRWTRITIGPYLPHLNGSGSGDHDGDAGAIERNDAFVLLLKSGGIKDAAAYSHAKLQLVRWHKLAINASMNPSAVLSGGSGNAAMVEDPELHRHLRGIMEEILTTAPKLLGEQFPSDFATAEQILKSTQRNKSGSKPSMLLDWEGGKRMELEVILGNPIRIAREKGLEMPRLQSVYALLRRAQDNKETERAKQSDKSKL